MITSLIDKQDNFEIIRDKIAVILASESVNQQALAVAGGKDPDPWKLRLYTERSNPWETWLNARGDTSPIVNVWLDNMNHDMSASNVVERQKTEAVYNIDCYGLGMTVENVGGGHQPGDEAAALEVQRCIRLVRNILMSSTYTYLDLRGIVWHRMVQSVTIFQPALDGRNVQKVVGARLAFRVQFNEFSPQYEPDSLEFLSVDVKRSFDGQIVAEADYDYT